MTAPTDSRGEAPGDPRSSASGGTAAAGLEPHRPPRRREGRADDDASDLAPIARERTQHEILARAEAFPSPPDILGILQEKANDENVEVTEIEGLIRQDPALVARLLRLVNSSYFGLRYKVNNVSHAVVLLGFKTLRSLIFAAFADEIYRHEMPAYGYARRGLWRHSVRSAFTARMLGLRGIVQRAAAEDLFVAGLLHDIGKLLLWPTIDRHAAAFRDALAQTEGDCLLSERAVCAIDHAEAGATVLRGWGLAENLVECIAHHHAPEHATQFPKQVSAVHLVDWILNELRVGLLPVSTVSVSLERVAVDILELERGAIDELKCWLAQTGGRDPVDD